MSKLALLEGLLLNLKGEIDQRRREYLPKSEAYRSLRYHTGQDFGDEVAAWAEWIKTHPKSIRTSNDTPPRLAKFLAFSKPQVTSDDGLDDSPPLTDENRGEVT
jgi:hypothetical protein